MRIAIDGPAGSGKTSVGKRVAKTLLLPFLDTGITYRATTKIALSSMVSERDEEKLAAIANKLVLVKQNEDNLQVYTVFGIKQEGLYTQKVESLVSAVSAHKKVRLELVKKQREASKDGIVMVGRDIGSVVLKDSAKTKIYLCASSETRSKRRAKQKKTSDILQVNTQIKARDEYDSTRKVDPLTVPKDAISIDTDKKTLEEVTRDILEIYKKRNDD